MVRFPKIQNSTITLYDCKNGFNVVNATHSKKKGGRKINEEEKEA
jgi:hypothetical protein